MILKLLKWVAIVLLIPFVGGIVGMVLSGIIGATGYLPLEYDPLFTTEAYGLWSIIGTIVVVCIMILIKFGILD